jgi:hypothetical protein
MHPNPEPVSSSLRSGWIKRTGGLYEFHNPSITKAIAKWEGDGDTVVPFATHSSRGDCQASLSKMATARFTPWGRFKGLD